MTPRRNIPSPPHIHPHHPDPQLPHIHPLLAYHPRLQRQTPLIHPLDITPGGLHIPDNKLLYLGDRKQTVPDGLAALNLAQDLGDFDPLAEVYHDVGRWGVARDAVFNEGEVG